MSDIPTPNKYDQAIELTPKPKKIKLISKKTFRIFWTMLMVIE